MNLTKEDFLALNKIYNDAISMAVDYFKLLHYRELYDETPVISIKYINENEIGFNATYFGKWAISSSATFVLSIEYFIDEEYHNKVLSPLINDKKQFDDYLVIKRQKLKEQEYKHYLSLKEKFENE